ncbi:MAG: hypothetical protein GF311_00270, partial [Candidatus Lokiarchaeota archaeon]|nr:hypothetical protein [Candidatus Lokiarchaeota archaeon]
MIEYCKRKQRKFEIVNLSKKKRLENLIFPFFKNKFRKEIYNFLLDIKPKLIIQPNDAHFYNDTIVKMAKEIDIPILVLQWAATAPEDIYIKIKEIKALEPNNRKTILEKLKDHFMSIFKFLVHNPIENLLRLNINHKISLGQGNSDKVGVINEYTKNLLFKQGVDEKKIIVVGSLNFDDIIKISYQTQKVKELERKLDKKNDMVIITYFSQPFYKKDLNFLTLEEQLVHLNKIYDFLNNFYSQ